MITKSIQALLIILLLSTSAYAGTVELPQTGQTTCYDTSGAVINCAGTGQDGEIQAGATWPSPRFTVSGECVTDNLTGLMWTKNGSYFGTSMNWNDAIDNVNGLILCGYSDWRLPNINELESLVNAEETDTAAWLNTQGFYNVQSYDYWSSSTYASGTYYAWFVNMRHGYVSNGDKANYGYVWPVRSGQ